MRPRTVCTGRGQTPTGMESPTLMQSDRTIFPEKRRRSSRLLARPPEDIAVANLRQMVLTLQAECHGWREMAKAREGYWLDKDVTDALREITEERDAADRRAVEAYQQAEDARA